MSKPASTDSASERPPVAAGSAPPAQDREELNHVFQSVARYFSVLSEPTRLKILHTICNEEQSVSAIVRSSGATQTNVSRHLAMMLQVGVVSRRRQGTTVFYKVIDPEFADMCRAVCVRIASRIEAGEPLRRELLEFAAQR